MNSVVSVASIASVTAVASATALASSSTLAPAMLATPDPSADDPILAAIDEHRAAYIEHFELISTEEERNVEISYIESRLVMTGFDHDPDITKSLLDMALALAVPDRSFTTATNFVAKDDTHDGLVLDCAFVLYTIDGHSNPVERAALVRLAQAGRRRAG
jgi:tellurite resistance protein